MKKQYELIFVLLTLVSGTFVFLANQMSPAIGATYMEGAITQDTTWTLVDSPFIVSKNILVYPNATLTIEPGVEVRFGQNLHLLIRGHLSAEGNAKAIVFTSNNDHPNPGDWYGIWFDDSSSSILNNVTITYAHHGVYAVNSSVSIRNSRVYFASENGLAATQSTVALENSVVTNCSVNGLASTASTMNVQYCNITNNVESGVNITGSGNVNVEHTMIMSNGNGIVVTGNSTSGVQILHNRIFANINNGFCIDAMVHSDITIFNNTVSANDYGFYISSPTSTYIGNNSVSFNNVGFYYVQGSHQAVHNDIYSNQAGMNVTAGMTVVDAECNYWGSSNGPYNEWLNPQGRGNPVGGNGTDLDFLFYLTHPIGHINTVPTAELLADKTSVIPGQPVMFVATNSIDEGHVDWYSFSFGDGFGTGWTTLSIAEHQYPVPGVYTAILTVMDDGGAISGDSIPVTVNASLTQALSVSFDANVTNAFMGETEYVALTVHAMVGASPMANLIVNMMAVKGGNFTVAWGLTDANGDFSTVYMAPDVADVTNVKLVATVSATELGYADEANSMYLEVRPLLSVQVNADPDVIKSEGMTPTTILVKSNDEPVSDATVVLSSTHGQLSIETGQTDLNGLLFANFTAPITTTQTSVQVTVTATATKDRFGEGVGRGTITVEPKILSVAIVTEPDVAISGGEVNVTARVTYESEVIANANVSIWATNGNLSVSMAVSDKNGMVLFDYTAPWVNVQTDVVIGVTATVDRYAEGTQTVAVIVNPRTFNITFNPTSMGMESGQASVVEVRVKCAEDDSAVPDAVVTVVPAQGTFAEASQTTDAAGMCRFTYTAPQTSNALNVSVTVGATRGGFVDGESNASLIVNPPSAALGEGGFPWLMVLLIAIPVAIAVVVVVLIKLRVIALSSSEETAY